MSTRFDINLTRNDAQAMQQPRHELAALIERVRELNDWSDTDVVRRATALGHKLSKSNISRVRNTDVVSLTGSTIKGLAAGLGIPEAEVARAALVSMDIDIPDLGGLDLETVIKMDTSISAKDRTMLLGLARQMRRPELEDRHGRTEEEQEPRTEAGSTVDCGPTGGDSGRPGATMNDAVVTRRVKVTHLQRKNQGHSHDTPPATDPGAVNVAGNRMPPPDQLREEDFLAARTNDDTSGMYPEDPDDWA
ncbi:hypothetical protein ACWDTG_06920 [Rhodococcus zopfii]